MGNNRSRPERLRDRIESTSITHTISSDDNLIQDSPSGLQTEKYDELSVPLNKPLAPTSNISNMSNISNCSEQLLNILKSSRMELPDFLLKHGTYNNLRNYLCNIEKDYGNTIMDLLLGNIGDELNKQKAIYELPTYELTDTIISICNYMSIKKIEELACGQGLLSAMLSKYCNFNIKATDGNRWMETFSKSKYIKTEQKLILNYVLDNNNYNDTMLIIGHSPFNSTDDLIKLIKEKTPKQFIILGEFYVDNNKKIIDIATIKNYKTINIPVKQLCYKDYFYNNTYFPTECCRSSLQLFVMDNNIVFSNLLSNINSNNLCEQLKVYTDKILIQDLINDGLFPKWVLDVIKLSNTTDIRNIIDYLSVCIIKKYTIPVYINCYDDFLFWYS